MKSLIILLLLNLYFCQISFSVPVVYHNTYLSYVSSSMADSEANYVKQKHLGGISLWELRGDTGFDEDSSLLKSIFTVLSNYDMSKAPPYIMSYWSNKNTYSKQQPPQDINHPPYAIPGSRDADGNTVTNADFNHKINGVNLIAYRALQAQTETYKYYDKKTEQMITINNKTPENIGTLYFSDPWTDLSTSGVSSIQDAFCRKNTAICSFSLENRNDPIALDSGTKMGNFNAFTTLEHSSQTNSLGPLKKIISIGGYQQEATFEAIFKNPTARNNFISSAKSILDAYPLDGIDLDYEDPQMTADNADHFALFIKQLKEAIPDKIISVTLLLNFSNYNEINNNLHGYSKENLRDIAQFATLINLKTHDFYGPYSISPNGPNITGLITNISIPKNAPKSYHLSIDHMVAAAIDAGIKPSQLTISIPAYGQALTGINSDNNGLFNSITSEASIPQGDLDPINCQSNLYPINSKSCSGSFQYNHIYKEMLPYDFSETNHHLDDLIIGSSAYADQWSPTKAAYYDLKITNAGLQNDIGVELMVGDFIAPDFFNPGIDKTYDHQLTHQINGKKNLAVKWSTQWGPSGECSSALNFTQSKHIIIKITPETTQGKYKTFCIFNNLSN